MEKLEIKITEKNKDFYKSIHALLYSVHKFDETIYRKIVAKNIVHYVKEGYGIVFGNVDKNNTITSGEITTGKLQRHRLFCAKRKYRGIAVEGNSKVLYVSNSILEFFAFQHISKSKKNFKLLTIGEEKFAIDIFKFRKKIFKGVEKIYFLLEKNHFEREYEEVLTTYFKSTYPHIKLIFCYPKADTFFNDFKAERRLQYGKQKK